RPQVPSPHMQLHPTSPPRQRDHDKQRRSAAFSSLLTRGRDILSAVAEHGVPVVAVFAAMHWLAFLAAGDYIGPVMVHPFVIAFYLLMGATAWALRDKVDARCILLGYGIAAMLALAMIALFRGAARLHETPRRSRPACALDSGGDDDWAFYVAHCRSGGGPRLRRARCAHWVAVRVGATAYARLLTGTRNRTRVEAKWTT
ncbi:MAG: hypothetical protein AAB426_11490, partial [Myxococcota bacterium]